MTARARVRRLPQWLAYRVRRSTAFLWRKADRAYLSLGLITFLLCALVSLALGPPPPAVHDEFSYLLAGDTFAHGRMTNPTHPLWQFFESFHVLPRPTYASKYQPAPGLFLAAGQLLSGFPIVGVWLSLGLATAAIGWTLRTWLPPGWSFLGALILGAGSLVVFRWGDSYWGGGVPLLGGALILGAAGRLCRRAGIWDGILLALGLVLLACSRPFEGVLASIPALTMLAACRWRSRRQASPGWRRSVLAFSVVASLGAGLMGYYDFRVTGSPWTLPYVAYLREYSYVPPLGWGPLGAPRTYRHEAFERFYREHAEQIYASTSTSPTRWSFKLALVDGYVFRPFVGYSLVLPLLLSLLRFRGPVPTALATCVLVLTGNLMSLWVFSHYFAAAGAALCLLIAVGLRRLMALRRPLGATLFAVVMVVAVVEGGLRYRAEIDLAQGKRQGWCGMRATLEAELEREPGPDLVVVRYDPDHSIHQEWVYNRADIDASPVVWAREMDAASNRRLCDYFAGRRIWLLDVGPASFSIVPYAVAVGTSAPLPAHPP